MVDHKIGSLVVYKDKKFLGIFTERGFAKNFANKGTNFLSSPISEALDSDVVNIRAYDSIEEAMILMTTTHNRHLPVIENDNLIGIVSIGDVIKHIVSEDHVTLLELESYISEADSA
jgi:CBS domain-containing protein